MKLSKKQQRMHWSLWKRVKDALMNGRETWSKDEENRRRHELYVRALGCEKSLTQFNDDDLDLVKAEFMAILEPGNLNAQLRQLNMKKTRMQFGLRKAMKEAGVGAAYVAAIAKHMNSEGQLGSSEIDQLDADGLRKVIIALHKHKVRGGGTVSDSTALARNYELREA